MILTTIHPGQDFNNLVDFCEKENVKPVILSYYDLPKYEYYKFIPGAMPYPDDRFSILSTFLQSVDEEEVSVIDWENILFTSTIEKENQKQKKTTQGVSFSQEPIKAQDFRLPPYMENLIMVAQSIGLDANDHLYNNNPLVLTPKMIKGSPEKLVECFSQITKIRQNIQNRSLSAVLPIINSNFFVE